MTSSGWWEPLEFVLPVTRDHAAWRLEVDTYDPAASGRSPGGTQAAGQRRTVVPRSILVLSDPRSD